jgi:uncharacterized protein (DUF433 family)
MSSTGIQTNYIVQDKGICSGKPRIDGTRMKVQHIALEYVHMGLNVEQICKSHPHINRGQIHAALSYYYDHQDEIEKDIKDDEEFAKRMEAEQR